MTTIDFPNSPDIGEDFSFGGRTWRWNGVGWEQRASSPPAGSITLAMIENLLEARVVGRAAGAGTGAPSALTAAQLRAIIGTGTLQSDRWLRGDGQWSQITHAGISGLSADDHPHYALADGSRTITGPASFASYLSLVEIAAPSSPAADTLYVYAVDSGGITKIQYKISTGATQTLAIEGHTHAAADITSGTLAAARMPALSGDITSSAGSTNTTLASGVVTYDHMQLEFGSCVLGVAGQGVESTFAPITTSTNGHVLRQAGGSLGFGLIDAASIGSGTLAEARGGTGASSVIAAIDTAKSSRCLFSVLDATEVANTTTETDLLNVSVLANTLGTRGYLEVTIAGFIYNQSGANITYTPQVKFGGTVLWGDVFSIAGNSVRKPFNITFRLANLNNTSKQSLHGWIHLHNATAAGSIAGIGDWGAASEQNNRFSHDSASYPAINTTSNQSLVVTMTMGTAHANGRFKIDHATVELKQAA